MNELEKAFIWSVMFVGLCLIVPVIFYTLIRIFTAAYWRSKLDVMKRYKQEEGED